MHIPEGLMDPVIWAFGFVVAFPVVMWAFRRLGRSADDEHVPFMAVLAAGLFVAQMLNFPIIGGTTGHLIGAALVTALLGPVAAMAILTIVGGGKHTHVHVHEHEHPDGEVRRHNDEPHD